MMNHMNALGRSGNLSASDVFGVSKSAASLKSFITNLLIKPNRFGWSRSGDEPNLCYSLRELEEALSVQILRR